MKLIESIFKGIILVTLILLLKINLFPPNVTINCYSDTFVVS